MKTYWSCSNSANVIRGTKKPMAATVDEWAEWKKTAKANSAFRFWLSETALDKLQQIITWPVRQVNALRQYVYVRAFVRSHALTSSSLKPGEFHEMHTRALHCMFDEFVTFVESEVAWNAVMWNDAVMKHHGPKWYRFGRWSNRELGVKQLEAEMQLVYELQYVGADDPRIGTPTDQAIIAKEILDLYQWWTTSRPNRKDPLECSGWNKAVGELLELGMLSTDALLNGAVDDGISTSIEQLESEYAAEDESMLIRLVKISRHLWT